MDTAYTVKTPSFEGPLELLLDLIEKKRLAVSDVSLSKVTDDFISYLKTLGGIPVAYTAHFIVTAATLVLIKSKSLLPGLSLTDEEEGSIDELKRRLEIYALYRQAGEGLKKIFGRGVLFKRPYPAITPIFVPDSSLTKERLAETLREAIMNVPLREENLPEATVIKAITLEEMIGSLTERVEKSMTLSFHKFSAEGARNKKESKVFLIVSFLAILELVKQGIVAVRQETEFDDISIEKTTVISV
ncbi:MAG: ScpA family protein [Patescibacteria group bacterium]